MAIAAAVVLAGAAVLWMDGDSASRAAERIRDAGSSLVVEVLVQEDWFDGDSVTVIIVDPASDQDARTVWCTVVEPVVVSDDLQVLVANEHVWWNPPTDCTNATDVPAGVVQVEFQDLPGGPYSSP